jgi:branched-chain amino acid transport system permease protein
MTATAESPTPRPSRVGQLRKVGASERARKIGTCFGLALVAAVITGPDGSQAHPTDGFRHSLLAPRVIIFLALGAVAAALVLINERTPLRLAQRLRPVTTQARRVRSNRPVVYAVLAVLALVMIFYPQNLSSQWQTILVDQMGIYVLLALGLNVVVGLAGLLDLGYIAFFAIGAYTTAYFTGKLPVQPPFDLNPFFLFPIAFAAAMLAGVILGGPTLRLRGDYLAIVTLGFGEIVRITAVNSDHLTNGPQGAFGVPHPSINLGFVHYKWTLDSLPYYYLLLVIVALVVFLFSRLEDSRVGRAWTAIREDEVAAAASGVPTLRFKLLAFAIGASTSGFAGVIYASKVGFINPDNFPLLLSILVLTMVIFGGMGSMTGVILGAAVLGWLPNALKDYVPATDRFIYFGALLIVMMIFRPQGLVPSKRRAREIALSEKGIGSADSLGATGGAA